MLLQKNGPVVVDPVPSKGVIRCGLPHQHHPDHALHYPQHQPPHHHPPRKEKLKTVLAIVTSYFMLNLPYAVNLLAEYGVQLKTENRHGNINCCFFQPNCCHWIDSTA